MTNTEINVAIAEACGWKSDGFGHWKNPNANCHEGIDGLPDYVNSLDAMHEAENKLLTTYVLMRDYENWLTESCWAKTWAFRTWNVEAKDRAIALLKTLGKWNL